MAKLIYSRHTPFGFIDPENASDADMFFGEEVELDDDTAEKVLEVAEALRALWAASASIQSRGFDSQSQAEEMAETLMETQDDS